ncbi:TIGR02680 family protein [Streptomyces sp. NPDC102381]|uniref:TIGR02680 family protein n=1 Tax=Streptomyces sp. NPDC102381 TaxID=3366164 RepID=UPI00381DCA43
MTVIPHQRTVDRTDIRFKPTRAGVIGLWDYTDEEFVFADGRLVLRGHNGSGKTKALEVLFPLVLDGVLDARRLDPFSGEERTMKSNLLYKGQDSAYGYVWMEFARTTPDREILEAVTVGIGMRVTKAMSTPAKFFFVTDSRVGTDFGLLDSASRPLRESALRKLLGDKALFGTAETYRDKIDERLFGLGRERYSQLVNLLLQLRRPLLAKDLDPAKVSATLTAGLRPVDEELVLQAARDFENLAEIQALLNALTGADTAVRNFLREYTSYLRIHARHRVDQVIERVEATAAHCEKITKTVTDRDAAKRELRTAEQDKNRADQLCSALDARLTEYQNHDAIKQQTGLRELRDRVGTERNSVAESERHLNRAQDHLATLHQEANRVVRRHDELQQAASRHTHALVNAARRCGILHDGEHLEVGAELDTYIAGQIAARRSDLDNVHKHLAAFEGAAKDQEGEQERCDGARSEMQEVEGESATAQDTLNTACEAAARDLNDHLHRWTGAGDTVVLVTEDGDALRTALGAAAESGAAPLSEVFHACTDRRRSKALAHVEELKRKYNDTANALTSQEEDRAKVASEADDAPPPSDLRPANRAGRPGAALWQLVRFAEHVPDHHAAALEGALYAAGLLTSWLHPDPAFTDQALRSRSADAYLRPLPPQQRPTGPTLADLLVVEDQEHVSAATVQTVLASIAVTDEVPTTNSATSATPSVSTDSHFCLGIQLGTHPKDRPEYIGATARAARRLERLHQLDASISALQEQLAGIEDQQLQAIEALTDFDRARHELPRAQAITEAARKVAVTAEKLAGARRRLTEAGKRLDSAIARAHEKNRQLRHAATAAHLPAERTALATVTQALDEFTEAGKELSNCREQAEAAARDISGRNEIIEEHTQSCTEQAAALHQRKDDLAVLAERLSTQEATLEAPLQEILQQISEAEQQITEARKVRDRARQEAQDQRDRLLTANNALEFVRDALSTAVGEQVRAALTLEPYARPDLLGLLDTQADTVWLPTDMWPASEDTVHRLMDSLTTSAADVTGADAARSILPTAVTSLIYTLDAATQGRPVTTSLLKSATTKISTAITTLEAALQESDQGYLLEWEPVGDIILARVTDGEGPAPVADFGRRLAEHLADQSVLLEDKERTVLEDGLLTGLAQQIHDRTVAARDLVASMDADTRARPMSSGTTVGITWIVSDTLTDSQRAINKLLDKDASALGPTGLAELRSHLRGQIRAKAAASGSKQNYQQVIAEVLDYRDWRKFELRLFRASMSEQEKRKGELLTKAKHSLMSGGEKSASIHLPLFAAAHAQYSSAYATCPRLIALDEAFAGIDEQYRPDLLALTAKFDLDLFMTGYDLWITYPQVPQISHYDMKHDEASHTVSAMLLVWDGEQILDDLGYPGSDELAAELLGFPPRRHVPFKEALLADTADEPAPERAGGDA